MPDLTRIGANAIANALLQVPHNTQSAADTTASELFVLKQFLSATNSRIKKHEDVLKEGVRAGTTPVEFKTDNYFVTATISTPRSAFDQDTFIETVSKDYNIPKHKLVELAGNCKKQGAAPISISVELLETANA